MYELEHMRSRQRYQDIIRWAQQERLAREIRRAQGDFGMVAKLRAMLITLISLVVK
jgi:hypothetical protein